MKSVVLLIVSLALANAAPFTIFENNNGEQYYLIPLERQRRDTTWDVAKGSGGTSVKLGQEGKIYENGNHEVLGGGFVAKNFDPNGPTAYGGTLGYHHVPTDTNVKAIVVKTPSYGTDVALQASRTLWAPDKNTKLEAYGGASQSFTPWGNTKPEANVGLQFSHGHNWFSG